MNEPEQQSTDTRPEAYEAPAVEVLGSVPELTLGSAGGIPDGVSMNNRASP